ncbi:MAG: hypothetical protein ACYC9Z_13965 [Casimicrobiaceae bacterium]
MTVIMSAQGATQPLEALIDAVVHKGADGELPAHLSAVLGSNGAALRAAVKQAVVRDGAVVRTFNVCTANRDDLVILTYDEQSQSTKAYLMSAAGALRKAVDYRTGGAAHERSLTDARRDFDAEIKFWADFSTRSKL